MNYMKVKRSLQNTIAEKLMEMFDLLLRHFGPQHWWPGDTAIEMMIGAVLTQNTNWKNVEKALKNLKDLRVLSLAGIRSQATHELAEKIRPAGYYNVKAKRLKNLIDFIHDQYGGDLTSLLNADTLALREGLLSIKGIGPETADSILLYAADRPVFVIDTYTHRILLRHGMIEEQATYDELQAFFMDHLPDDVDLFNEFHALIVRTGKEFCRKKPLCPGCPLKHWGHLPPFL
jgi:endonuclease-3 related protein